MTRQELKAIVLSYVRQHPGCSGLMIATHMLKTVHKDHVMSLTYAGVLTELIEEKRLAAVGHNNSVGGIAAVEYWIPTHLLLKG